MLLAYIALSGRIFLLGLERIIVKKLGQGSGSVGAAFLFFFTATLFLIPPLFFVQWPDDWSWLHLLLIASFIYAVAFVLYVRSLSLGEASLVSPLYNFNILFLLVLTTIFLGEKFTLIKLGGLLLLLIGSSFLNRKGNILKSLHALIKDRACQLMILCSLLMAFGRTVDGFIVRQVDPLVYSFLIYSGITIWLALFITIKNGWKSVWYIWKQKPVIALSSGMINAYSYVLLVFSFKYIDVSIAEPLSLLGILVTVVLSYFIFREKIRERLIAVVIMLIGAWLLIGF